jgi:hypothetical protein
MYRMSLEHLSVRWIRLTVKKCGTAKKRAGSPIGEPALAARAEEHEPR